MDSAVSIDHRRRKQRASVFEEEDPDALRGRRYDATLCHRTGFLGMNTLKASLARLTLLVHLLSTVGSRGVDMRESAPRSRVRKVIARQEQLNTPH